MIHIAVLLALSLPLGGCSEDVEQASHDTSALPRRTLDQEPISDVVPLFGGGAYIVSDFGPPWYVTDTEAVRVRAVGSAADDSVFTRMVLLRVIPTLDGGAYAYSLIGTVWRLKQGRATRIKEVTVLSPAPSQVGREGATNRDQALLLYAAQRQRQQLDERVAGHQSSDSDSSVP